MPLVLGCTVYVNFKVIFALQVIQWQDVGSQGVQGLQAIEKQLKFCLLFKALNLC